MFVTNGVYADLYCVAAKTGLGERPSQNISMFLVEKEAPGFRVGKKLEKHGWRSSDTAELIFDDCRIPVSNLLGDEGRGFYAIMQNFQNERIVMGAMAMGEAQAAIDLTLDWTANATPSVHHYGLTDYPSSLGNACRQDRSWEATCFPYGLVGDARELNRLKKFRW